MSNTPLTDLIEASKARLAAMTKEEQQAMWMAQRESFARAMSTPCEHGVLDFEQCDKCRNPTPSSIPELGSGVVNDACWKFVEAMPHQIPGPIFNDLKPAIYAAICHVLNANPTPETSLSGWQPVVYVSSKQLPHNPDHAYIACRPQPEGNFDTPLYAAQATPSAIVSVTDEVLNNMLLAKAPNRRWTLASLLKECDVGYADRLAYMRAALEAALNPTPATKGNPDV